MHAISRTIGAVTGALVITAFAPDAHAAKEVHEDAVADVVQIDDATDEVTPAPEETEGDVTRFVVDHRDHNVIIRASFTALHHPDEFALYFVPLLTNESVRRDLVLFTTPERPQGKPYLATGGGDEVACAGLDRKVDYAGDAVWLKVPRSCLSGPRWVKAGLGWARQQTGDEATLFFADDAMKDGSLGEERPALGSKVFRG